MNRLRRTITEEEKVFFTKCGKEFLHSLPFVVRNARVIRGSPLRRRDSAGLLTPFALSAYRFLVRSEVVEKSVTEFVNRSTFTVSDSDFAAHFT